MEDTVKQKIRAGFSLLCASEQTKETALQFLETWLTNKEFSDYKAQIEYLIDAGKWEILLDSFYQILPFGTAGRRGLVGIGPNRINVWTIQTSAQGHAQYLIKNYGNEARTRGIVICYDVRQYLEKGIYNDNLPNPVAGLSCKDLAQKAVEVYTGNGIKTYFFNGVRSTPELCFAIRYLKALAGDMISASHNPPSDNGKKVFDSTSGQLIPPFDEELLIEVTRNVKGIQTLEFNQAVKEKTIVFIGEEIDSAYVTEVIKLSLSSNRSAKIVYTPFHGTGITSAYRVLKNLGFSVFLDPKTSNPSGRFENIIFNIPNPEVQESFTIPLEFAKEQEADVLFASDPDADRMGMMLNLGNGKWQYFNGNEMGVILLDYVLAKYREKGELTPNKTVIKTTVTTSLIETMATANKINCINDLLIGYKYIGDVMNQMEAEGRSKDLVLALEESHGYVSGNYIRDKDGAIAIMWLAELIGELKDKGQKLDAYLKRIYAKYGYFRNYLTEIRLLGALGQEQIASIQKNLRTNPPCVFDNFEVLEIVDRQKGPAILSMSDLVARNVLIFKFKSVLGVKKIKVTIRPSGTDPKIKIYIEIGTDPLPFEDIDAVQLRVEKLLKELEKAFMVYCYHILGVDFPDRGFLLFWQLPLEDKLKYFKIELEIEKLKDEPKLAIRKEKLNSLLKFLGSDPIKKVDKAFVEKYGIPMESYLGLI